MSVIRLPHIFNKHHVYTKAPALAYSFHDLGNEASLVKIATILPELRLLIQHYIDIVNYVGSFYGKKVSFVFDLGSYQGYDRPLKCVY
jgi:hypothetical protein